MEIHIAKIREEQGLSQSELHRRSGVSVSHIHNIENSVKSPTIEILCKLSKALDVPCCELFSCD